MFVMLLHPIALLADGNCSQEKAVLVLRFLDDMGSNFMSTRSYCFCTAKYPSWQKENVPG